MDYEKAIKERTALEIKYLNMAINKRYKLKRADNRITAPSPSAYKYLDDPCSTSISSDIDNYSYYSNIIHDKGLRAGIEEKLIKLGICEYTKPFFYSQGYWWYDYYDDNCSEYIEYYSTIIDDNIRNLGRSISFMYYINTFLACDYKTIKLISLHKAALSTVAAAAKSDIYDSIEVSTPKGYKEATNMYLQDKEEGVKYPPINKNKFNLMSKLCKEWKDLAKQEHLKIQGVHKRLIKKYKL